MNHDEKPAFSCPVKVGDISARAVTVHFEANEAERRALRDLWNVSGVLSLRSDLEITRWKKDGVRIRGRVTARVVQACVVTLEPVESTIDEPVDAIFVPEGSRLAQMVAGDDGETIVDPEGPDIPGMFTGDTIDAGPVVAEQVALALDFYPRRQGAVFDGKIGDGGRDDHRHTPFAMLKNWKNN